MNAIYQMTLQNDLLYDISLRRGKGLNRKYRSAGIEVCASKSKPRLLI